jgi:hypothetical protein
MVPGYDMYKFMIYCSRKTQNLKLKDRIMSIFDFYGEDDPYFIAKNKLKGIETAAGNYCKDLTFSNAANRTPLMLLDWILKKYSSKLKSKLIVKERKNYISVQYSKIIKEFEDIFSFTRVNDGKDNPDNALALINKCMNSKPSYVMAAYGIKVLEKYNKCLECNELKAKIDLLYKELTKSKDYLLTSDRYNLEKVFAIKTPSQEELDLCISKVLKIKIRHSNAKEKEDAVKNLENLLLYQEDLKPYLQFYFTILELNDRSILKDWINRFKVSGVYLFHIKNVAQNERATRWSQTLMASII